MAASFVDCHADLLPSLRGFLARVYRPDYVLCNNEALFRWQFGEVTKGMEVVDQIVNAPRGSNDLPKERIEMTVSIVEK